MNAHIKSNNKAISEKEKEYLDIVSRECFGFDYKLLKTNERVCVFYECTAQGLIK